jgi:hypothetical protein
VRYDNKDDCQKFLVNIATTREVAKNFMKLFLTFNLKLRSLSNKIEMDLKNIIKNDKLL